MHRAKDDFSPNAAVEAMVKNRKLTAKPVLPMAKAWLPEVVHSISAAMMNHGALLLAIFGMFIGLDADFRTDKALFFKGPKVV